MEKIKTILDRKPISSEYINSKQDFGRVLNGVQNLKTPIWRSTWFYGTVGVATVAIIVAAVTLTGGDSNDMKNDSGQPQVVASNMEKDDSQSEIRQKPKDQVDQVEVETDNQSVKTEEVIEVTEKVEKVDKSQPKEKVEETTVVTTNKREKPEEKTEKIEIGMPSIAGVSSGAISINSICQSNGLHVEGAIIYGYTIQYRSCARDVVAKIRGNRVPSTVCDEIRDCGNSIEISFLNIEGRDRDNTKVNLDDFTVVATPR